MTEGPDTANSAASEAGLPPDEAVSSESLAEAEKSEESKPLTPEEMDQFECLSCGYLYEPAKGDDRSSIPRGVAFADLPSPWRCPVCGAPKQRFANVGPQGAPSGFKENLNFGLGVNALTPGQKNILIFGALALGFLFFLSLYGLN